MGHWLDEAEKDGRLSEPGSSLQHERTLHKKERILANYIKYKLQYDDFISRMHHFIDRVNSLPIAKREPFGQMDARSKDSKLNNHLNIFSSSRKLVRPGRTGIFSWFKKYHFKHIRVLYIHVPQVPGMAEMEIKENYIVRTALNSRSKSAKGIKPTGKSERLHVLFYIDMNKLNHEIALDIIDWLAFSREIEDTDFFKSINSQDIRILS
jgi:hypothetical protein